VNFESFLEDIEDDLNKMKDEEKVKEDLNKKFKENCENLKDMITFFQFFKNGKRRVFLGDLF
jgi:hypothetical protein